MAEYWPGFETSSSDRHSLIILHKLFLR